MTATRRTRFNFGLQHAVDRAIELGRPLVILEALRCDYQWASDRFHQFVLDGMTVNARECGRTTALYYAYVERRRHEARGLVRSLSVNACVVVTDWYPGFFLPRMLNAAAAQVVPRSQSE